MLLLLQPKYLGTNVEVRLVYKQYSTMCIHLCWFVGSCKEKIPLFRAEIVKASLTPKVLCIKTTKIAKTDPFLFQAL